jgi:hypothetical protein
MLLAIPPSRLKRKKRKAECIILIICIHHSFRETTVGVTHLNSINYLYIHHVIHCPLFSEEAQDSLLGGHLELGAGLG